jgi:hypothetical protein
VELEVERKLAQRHRMLVTGSAMTEVGRGCEVEIVRKAGTRVEVVRPS